MAQTADGNAQRLIRLAGLLVESAAHQGAFEIGAEAVDEALPGRSLVRQEFEPLAVPLGPQ